VEVKTSVSGKGVKLATAMRRLSEKIHVVGVKAAGGMFILFDFSIPSSDLSVTEILHEALASSHAGAIVIVSPT
jgi:hypothetical protein